MCNVMLLKWISQNWYFFYKSIANLLLTCGHILYSSTCLAAWCCVSLWTAGFLMLMRGEMNLRYICGLSQELWLPQSWLVEVVSRGPRCLRCSSFRELNQEVCDTCNRNSLPMRCPSAASSVRRNWLVFLLLLISGYIHPNPGPELAQLQTLDEFKSSNGLHFFQLNVCSLVN